MAEEDRLAAILASWHDARERGEPIDAERAVRENPDLAEDLRGHLRALASFDRLLGAARVPEEVPAAVGEFRVIRLLGRGGMGAVYEAEQPSLGRRVALKILHPSLVPGPRAAERFRLEARAAASLRHPNLVPVYGLGEEGDVRYYAMELIRGRTLEGVARADLPGGFRGIARLFAGAADGLQAAHDAGVVHRDVKPSNLLLDENGALRVADFGLARMAGAAQAATLPGTFLGTPAYASPEMASGGRVPVDARTDVYSLGATLYETLAGAPPHGGEDLRDVLARVLAGEPPPLGRLVPDLPRDLGAIVRRAMETNPADRYPTAAEFARDLRRFADGEPVRARPAGPLGRALRLARRHPVASSLAAGVLLLGAVAGAVGAWAAREERLRREAEYLRFCAWSLQVQIGDEIEGAPQRAPADFQNLRSMLAGVASRFPERPEAHLELALANGATVAERLGRLDRAQAGGVGARALALARVFVFHKAGRMKEAALEQDRVVAAPPGPRPEDAYFEGRVLLRIGRRAQAIERLRAAVEGAPAESDLALLVRSARGIAHFLEGDADAALADFAATAAWEQSVGIGNRTEVFRLAHILGSFRRDPCVAAVIPLPDQGGPLVVDSVLGRVFVLDGVQGGRFWILDGRTGGRVAAIPTEGFDIGIALDAERHEVYVAQQFGRHVTVADGRTGERIRTFDIPPREDDPEAIIGEIALDARRGRLYVARRVEEVLAVEARAVGTAPILLRIPVDLPGGERPEIALDAGAGRLYAARPATRGIRAYDVDSGAVVARGELPFDARAILADPPRGRLLALSSASNALAVLDGKSLAVLQHLALPAGNANAVAVDAGGNVWLAGKNENGPLTILEEKTLRQLALVPIAGSKSREANIALDPVTRRAYIAYEDGWVNVVDDPLAPPKGGK